MTGSIGPYRILRKLGAGGMGEVFLAEDERLGRRVALKCPSDAWLQEPDARARVQREARAAAQLTHPNIAAVYDVLDDGARPYIVMEYVEGESLSTIASRGALPVERAVAIARQIADGLAAAHAAGIIHRDLKPGNVMVTPSGQVKLLDFGVARMIDPRAEPLTAAGQVVGTPGYVAPEQLLGRPADARSDIYSAGLIIYQLLTGRAPWIAPTEGRALEALLTGVRDLREAAPHVPSSVADVVMRAVAREPEDRYPSAPAFLEALERAAASLRDMPTVATGQRLRVSRRGMSWMIAVSGLVLLILAGMPYVLRGRGSGRVTAGTLPVVAVLPLANLSGDPKLDYMGAGMADTMSTKLAGVSGLSVVSRAEVHDALARNPEIGKVCRALGASYVVTGSLQQSGERVQVTLNLLSPDGATIVDGAVYDDASANLFALQRRIAEDLARRITGRVTPQDREHLARVQTNNVGAISAYWRGRGLLEQPAPAPIDPAIDAFTQAVADDGSFALGYAGLGAGYWRKYELTKDPQWAGKALEASEHARQLAPEEPEVLLSLATVYNGVGRAADAIQELTRALKLQPANDRAHRLLGDIHTANGRPGDAEQEYAAAITIRPEYWATYRSLGLVQLRQHRYDEAIKSFRRVTELQPDSPIGWQLLGNASAASDDLDAAITNYEAAIQRGGTPATYSSLGTVYYMRGRFEDAANAYEEAIARRPNSAVTHWNLADAYRRLGRDAAARAAYAESAKLAATDLQINPNDALAMATRATCLARLDRTREAVEQIGRAAAIAPSDPDVQYQRAIVLTLAGRPDAAIDALEQAVRAGYSAALLRADEDLAALRDRRRFQSLVNQPARPADGRAQDPRREQ